jgi:hypothetical protein
MRTMMRSATLVALTMASVAALGGRTDAGFITYTETVIASGSLNGTAFTNASLTISATANTTQIISGGGGFFSVIPTSNSFTITGVGSGSFTSSIFDVFVNQTFSSPSAAAGFGGDGGASILDTFNSAFSTYALATAIGPISGSSFINSGSSFATTAGGFVLTSTTGNVSFTATPAGVPEPSSLAMCGVAGMIGLVVARMRRKRA